MLTMTHGHGCRLVFNTGVRADDLCPGLGGLAPPPCWGQVPLPLRQPRVLQLGKFDHFTYESRIFMLICRISDTETVTAIGNKSYSHFNAQTRDNPAKYWGGGAFAMLSPIKLLGTCPPRLTDFGAYANVFCLASLLFLRLFQIRPRTAKGSFTGRMPFLSPNHQCQSTEWKNYHIPWTFSP